MDQLFPKLILPSQILLRIPFSLLDAANGSHDRGSDSLQLRLGQLTVDQWTFNCIFDHGAVRLVSKLAGKPDDLQGFAGTLGRRLSDFPRQGYDRLCMRSWIGKGQRISLHLQISSLIRPATWQLDDAIRSEPS
ncbi:hypothetical protein [Microvirga aerophila]|uniref:hypothetical protein n=1 Tax=Microvirga aerophila TaxID=670291 RepID=UPI0011BF77EF|nr:hypothetical protein [Microvirga aerophila]